MDDFKHIPRKNKKKKEKKKKERKRERKKPSPRVWVEDPLGTNLTYETNYSAAVLLSTAFTL